MDSELKKLYSHLTMFSQHGPFYVQDLLFITIIINMFSRSSKIWVLYLNTITKELRYKRPQNTLQLKNCT